MALPSERPPTETDPSLEALSRQLRRGRLRAPIAVALLVVGAVVTFLVTCHPVRVHDVQQEGGFTFRDGDLLFVSCAARLCRVIEGVTESPFSHVGMVSGHGVDATVVEAYAPVGEVPLAEFLERSHGAFTLMRWVDEPAEKIDEIKQAMRQFYGRPYDPRYRWDDEAIYCTELVYKAVEQATGIEVAPLRRLGELDYEPYREFIVQLEGSLPLDRLMITPADMQRSRYLRLVHTTIDLP